MAEQFLKFNGTIDRRSPRSEGDPTEPIARENLLCRDGKLSNVDGTEKFSSTQLDDKVTWLGRYTTSETGIEQPKTYAYTQDGKLHKLNDYDSVIVKDIKTGMNINAYPKSWTFKVGTINYMYLVDGLKLWKFNGNNDNIWEDVKLVDINDDDVKPIDVIEHKDRLFVISELSLYISANLDPDNFTDPIDSLEIVVGSGKGKNLALAKIEDFLFILNTEGIFVLRGDTISAVAQTFEIDLVEICLLCLG